MNETRRIATSRTITIEGITIQLKYNTKTKCIDISCDKVGIVHDTGYITVDENKENKMGILSAIAYYINRRIFAKRPADVRMDVIARISSGEIDMNKMEKYTTEEAQVMARFTQEELEELTNVYKNKGEWK